MAYVKILNIKSVKHIGRAIEYIENPEKTNEQDYVSGYACEPATAASDFLSTKIAASRSSRRARTDKKSIEAFHIIQSFAPGEVTPEKAHEIGMKLANEVLGGRFEFVIATHVDKAHIHNHIIANSVSFYNYKKFHTQPYKTIAQLRDISNRLSLENDLSVISPGKLGTSYKEWMERNRNSSWKSEIRKRLNFILTRATSYEEFKAYCVALHLYYDDTHKQNRFRLPGQERVARGDTLDKENNSYSVEGIKEKCADNLERRKALQEILRKAVLEVQPEIRSLVEPEARYQVLAQNLQQKGIQLKETYRGLRWALEDERCTAGELGSGFSKDDLLEALEKGRYEPQARPRDIAEEWEDTNQRKQTNKKDVQVTVPEDAILKISVSGILMAIPDTEQRIFLTNRMLDFDEDTKTYLLHLNPAFEYSLAPKKIDPDIRLADQEGKRSIRGEDLLRSLELKNGVQPQIVEVSGTAVRSLNEKGLTLTLPQDGIDHIFIPKEYVISDEAAGKLQVKLYEHWNYTFRTQQGYQSVTGANLAMYLAGAAPTPEAQIRRQIAAMERKSAWSALNQLNDIMWTLNNEGVKAQHDFNSILHELQDNLSAAEEKIAAAKKIAQEYREVLKCLRVVQSYQGLNEERARIPSPWRQQKFFEAHKTELTAYDQAKRLLQQSGIPTEIDLEKAQALLEQQTGKINDLEKSRAALEERMQKLRTAKAVVANLQCGESRPQPKDEHILYE